MDHTEHSSATEEFRPVPGLSPIVEVSRVGTVRLKLDDGPVVVQPYKNGPYMMVTMKRSYMIGPPFIDRTANYARVHELILLAWKGPRPTDKHRASFKNNNPRDLSLDNLIWVTPAAVARDTHDRRRRAQNLATPGEMTMIVTFLAKGYNPEQIADHIPTVTPAMIRRLVNFLKIEFGVKYG